MNGKARFDANIQTLQQVKFTEEIYSQISFTEIIVIIVKEIMYIEKSCNMRNHV